MKRVELAGLGLDASSGLPLVILREDDEPHRLLPIFVGGPEAAAIALAVSGEVPPRPLTHDLMASLVESLAGQVDSVEVTELRDGAFLASLAVHGPAGERRLDTRPSDAIALAVRLGAPLFVAEAVLDEAGTEPAVEVDEAAIDEAVDQFRSFLDEVDASQFAAGPSDPAREPPPSRGDRAGGDGETTAGADEIAAGADETAAGTDDEQI